MDSCEFIKIQLIEEEIHATLVEEVINTTIVEEEITAQIIEETIEAKLFEETIEAKLFEEQINVSIECWPGTPGGAGGVAGQLYVVGVSGSSVISDIEYAPGTVPADAVIVEATTDIDAVTIHFMAEGGANYSPIITVDGIVCTNIEQYPNDRRLFFGSVTIQVPFSRNILLSSNTGVVTSVSIFRGAGAPEILSINFSGGYPNTDWGVLQTEVKQGDSFSAEIHFEPTGSAPVSVQVHGGGAFLSELVSLEGTELIWGSIHKATISLEVDSTALIPRPFPVVIHAINDNGSEGDPVSSISGGSVDGVNFVTCCDITPELTHNPVVYPTGQGALKGTETGTINDTVSDYTSLFYTALRPELEIQNPSSPFPTKQVVCTNPGIFNDSYDNVQVRVRRDENGTTTIATYRVEIADIAPIVTISQPHTRLRSSPTGESYLIEASSDQKLIDPPGVLIPVSGTWVGDFTGSEKYFTNTITIQDTDASGEEDWEWSLIPLNLAGIPAVIEGRENVGGFVSRDILLEAFATQSQLDAHVTLTNKLNLIWSFKAGMLFQDIGSTPPIVNGWTIDSAGVDPTTVMVLDTSATNASSQQSILSIEEVI